MASTKRTWLWVILGIVGTLFLLVVILIGGAIYEFRTHVKTQVVESAVAEQEFTRQREKFNGQEPLIEYTGDDRGTDKANVHRPPATDRRVPINALHVLIYDLNQGNLVRVNIPGWLLRMMPNGRYSGFDDEAFTRNRITLEDLERHGPGLILQGRNRDTRILIWSE